LDASENDEITHVVQSALVDIPEEASEPSSYFTYDKDYLINQTIRDIGSYKIDGAEVITARSEDSTLPTPPSIDEKHHEKLMKLAEKLLTDELIAGFILGDEGIGSYHGNLDEEYARHLLSRLPANSALLFSQREGNDLMFVVATRDPQGQLLLYDDNFSNGYDWVAQDFKMNLGLQFVGYEEAGALASNRWQRTVPKENPLEEGVKDFLSTPGRDAILKNNIAIAQSSTYYQGYVTGEEAEDLFKNMRAPVGTALLRYDNNLQSFFISYVGVDAVIQHEKIADVGNAMQKFAGLSFLKNDLQVEEVLGKKEPFYCGEMSDAQAEEYLKGESPDRYAVMYSRTMNDGRVNFYAGINKTVSDESGEKGVVFTSYEIGQRPDFDGSWVGFYAENPMATLINPQELSNAQNLVRELLESGYTHHNIDNAAAEKLLKTAVPGAVILHTQSNGANEQIVFSVKLPNKNHIIHRTLPADAALVESLAECLTDFLGQPAGTALPNSLKALFDDFHEKRLGFIWQQEPKKEYLSTGIKIKKFFPG
jgi:hypothetical protein